MCTSVQVSTAIYVNLLIFMTWLVEVSFSSQASNHVTVQLNSKWNHSPLHLETSEFLAEESNELFWKFINEVVKLEAPSLQQRTEEQQYEAILKICSKLLSPAKIALLKLALSLRVYSPTVETFHQIARDKKIPTECESAIEINGRFVCDAQQFEKALSTLPESKTTTYIYKVDHRYPGSSSAPITVILYGEIGTPTFNSLHRLLQQAASGKKVEYIFRHYIKEQHQRQVQLSGYGVELAIKSTEYKAQDEVQVRDGEKDDAKDTEKTDEVEGFVFSKLKKLYPDDKDKLEKFKMHLLDSAKELAALKAWELQELSLQAAQRIKSSPLEDSLKVMQDIAQNFPTRAKSLVHTSVTAELKKEIDRNQQMFLQFHNLGPSDTALFVNGMYFDVDVIDMFTLLQILRQETRLLEGLHDLQVPDTKIAKLLKLDMSDDRQDYAVDIRDTAVQYVNDVENDRQYRNWPSSLHDLLRPTYPGMLRNVKKNIYHLVIIVDPSCEKSKDIVKLAESFYVHKAPLRIGVVFAVNPNQSVTGQEDAGVAMLNAYNFISQDKLPYDGLSFITDVYAATEDAKIKAEDIIKMFKTKYPHEDLDMVFGADSDYDTGRKLAWDFVNRTGIGEPPQVLLNGVILKKSHLTADMFEEAVLTEVMRQTPIVQKSVYLGELTDSHDVLDYLMQQSHVMPRLNQRILSPGGMFIDMVGRVVALEELEPVDFEHLSQADMTATLAGHLRYLLGKEEEAFRPLTVWVVGDFETLQGQELLASAILYLKSSKDMRLAIIHNPSDPDRTEAQPVTLAVQVAVDTLEGSVARPFLAKLTKKPNVEAIWKGKKNAVDFATDDVDGIHFSRALAAESSKFLQIHSRFCRKVLGLSPGEKAVVANGRIIGPLRGDEEFTEDDFNLLEWHSMNHYGNKLSKELKGTMGNHVKDSNLMMKVASVLLMQPQTRVRHEIKFHEDKHSMLDIPARDPDHLAHEIAAIVDPVSRGAQKLAPVLIVLQRVINAHYRIFFNCIDRHSSMPLKSYYRFVLDSEPRFATDGSAGSGPTAFFDNLPTAPLFTLGMVTPENWLVESVKANYDLDNIHLAKVVGGVNAEFELEYLLLEGHCFEQSTGNPPRGLQFTLGTNSTPVIMDTIVMANLGYFQLKANPGVWLLRLRQGRSADIYDIASEEGTDTPPGSPDAVVAISNFRSQVIKIRVSKKAGKQREELLSDESDSQGGIWNTITSLPIVGGIVVEWRNVWTALRSQFSGEKKDEEEESDNKINIFSLASGHLYERLLRIMMLSVLKHTKTPVKFWFLKNYLSPTFKHFMPYMAKKYGFEYELVQYKWPRWLNQQSEKQRIIWGYKILFLDVLFPLDVKKIIFVDADQVVRADMKELRDLDLGGAPYGYTPFCDSRTDMDGYRFWKSGYWASHLAGRKYHISALYVVDLKKFRRIAAGDRLRGQYQGLSQDPNSLSNLDQDLPNNMIHQVSIKSLPQEWLWCETWCNDDSKQYAKTIDLCNNPKTKEHKLASAVRIIPEWTGYNEEVKKVFEEYQALKEAEESKSETEEDGAEHGVHEEL